MEGYLWMRRLYGGDWELGFRVRAAGGRGCVWMSGRFGRGPWRLGYGLCFSYVNRRRVWAAFSVRVGGRRSTEQPCQRAARRGFAPGNSVPLIKSVVSRVEPEGTSAGLPFAYHFFCALLLFRLLMVESTIVCMKSAVIQWQPLLMRS